MHVHPPVCTHTHTQTHTYTNIAHYILILYKSEIRNTLTGGVSIAVNPNGTTSITVSWMVISTPTGYVISYCNIDNTQCFTISNTTSIAGSLSSYIIEHLQEATQYSITVSIVGRSDQDTVEATTMAAGMSINESTLHCVYYL